MSELPYMWSYVLKIIPNLVGIKNGEWDHQELQRKSI